MINVLQVLYSGLGGHASVAFSLIDGDREQAWNHQLVFYGIEPLHNEHALKASVRKVPYKDITAIEGKPLRSWGRFYNSLRKANPDIILLHSNSLIIPAWWYCRQYRKKLLVVEHTPNQVKRKVDKYISVLAQYVSDKIVLLSKNYFEELRNMQGWLFKKKKTLIIPNGIDIDYFKPTKKENFNNPILLGMAARFSNTKEQALLIKTLEVLKKKGLTKFTLILAGDGDQLQMVKKLASECGLADSVKFTGSLDEPELLDFFHRVDIYLHASKGETMSTSIMQAMACGLPVVASDIPGINNLLVQDSGILVENNVEEYATAIEMLATNIGLAKKIAYNARLYAEKEFSNKKMFKSYNEIINQFS